MLATHVNRTNGIRETIKQLSPAWLCSIAGAVECLSANEAKDIIALILPNASHCFLQRNRLIAKKNDVQYEIIACDMKHEWDEDHCTDAITIRAYQQNQCVLKKHFKLCDVHSIEDVIVECSLHV